MTFRDTPWPEGTPCWVEVLVGDQTRSSAFYAQLFGWTFVDHGPAYQHYLTARLEGRAVADIGPLPPGPPGPPAEGPPAWLVCLAVESADAAAERITEAGGALELPPTDVGDHGRFAVARDPAGARFAVWQADTYLGAEVTGVPGSVVWYQCRTTDPGAAAAFYTKVFGHTPGRVAGSGGGGGCDTLDLDGRPVAGLSGVDAGSAPEAEPSHWEVTFGVRDLDAAAARVTALGGAVRGAPFATPAGPSVPVTDPLGTPFHLLAVDGQD